LVNTAPHGMSESAVGCLVIAPHFDDEVLACGATLARLRRQRIKVVVCALTWSERAFSGTYDAQEHVRRNRQQAESALENLGVKDCLFPDEFWPSDTDLHVRADMSLAPRSVLLESLISLIRRTRPLTVITTHPRDFHNDHRAAAISAKEAVYQAARAGIAGSTESFREPILLHGLVDVEHETQFRYDVYSPVSSEELECKVRALSAYSGFVGTADYEGKSLFGSESIRDWIYASARLRGLSVGHEFAEAFELGNFSPQVSLDMLIDQAKTRWAE